MTLTRYGIREWGLATAAAVVMGVWFWPNPWVLGATGLLWVAVAGFFRDPRFRRPTSSDPRDLVSPADGVVSAIVETEQHDAVEGPALIVRIFLSVLDVHINRSPCDAEVVALRHTPGKFLDARTEESAQVNESNIIQLKLKDGLRIGVRQVSGAIARRIVCPLRPGDCLARAERFGMIKFGSTTELIVPRSSVESLHVAKGDRVRGGVTTLVRLRAAR